MIIREIIDKKKQRNALVALGGVLIVIILIFALGQFSKAYSVTFDTDGGNEVPSLTVNKDGTVTRPENPVKEGFTFVYWELDGEEFDFSQPITADISLEAKWEPITFTITFDANGGSNVDDQVIAYGEIGRKPNDPTREGFVFLGWFSNDEEFDFSQNVNEEIVLVAKWDMVDDETTDPDSDPVVTTRTEKRTSVINFKTIEENDSTLEVGKTVVKQNGVNGELTITYTVNYSDGKETQRKEESRITTKLPVNKIILIGTKKAVPVSAITITTTPVDTSGLAHDAGSVSVSLATVTAGAEIRYTTNGDAPTSGSTLYAGPFTVTNPDGINGGTVVVKAIGIKSGMTNSAVATRNVVYNAATTAIVTTVTEFQNAIINNNIGTITLGGDITGDVTAERLESNNFTINFGTYVLVGDLDITANSVTSITFNGSAIPSIDGDLEVTAGLATVTNNINVSGIITISDVGNNSWIEEADGNSITLTDSNGATIVINGNRADITVATGAGGGINITANSPVTITVDAGATVSSITASGTAAGTTITNNGTVTNVTADSDIVIENNSGDITAAGTGTVRASGTAAGSVTGTANIIPVENITSSLGVFEQLRMVSNISTDITGISLLEGETFNITSANASIVDVPDPTELDVTAVALGTTSITVRVYNDQDELIKLGTIQITVRPELIAAVAVTMDAPVLGETPQTAAQVENATGNADYTVTNVVWHQDLTAAGNFKAGVPYTARVTLTSKNNKAFNGTTVSIAGSSDSGAKSVFGTNVGNRLEFNVAFSTTGALAVTGIEVTTQPTKTTYAEGTDDVLALNGMVVTETNNDGSTTVVPFADGTAAGYSADPENGAILDNATHDDNPVVITRTASRQTANTANLTVAPPTVVSAITVTQQDQTLTVGATLELSVTFDPTNATNKNVTWASNDTNVATVSSTGVITAVGAGEATITVTTADGGKTDSIGITVAQIYNQTQNTTHSEIQIAINEASEEDIILVGVGTYEENLIINNPLTLLGPNAGKTGYANDRGPEATILNNEPLGTNIQIASTDVTVDGFTIEGGEDQLNGIYFNETYNEHTDVNVTVKNNRVLKFGSQGSSSERTIRYDEYGRGIYFANGDVRGGNENYVYGIKIQGNYVQYAEGGIVLKHDSYAEVSNNKIEDCYTGIFVEWFGMSIGVDSLAQEHVENHTIHNNTVIIGDDYGWNEETGFRDEDNRKSPADSCMGMRLNVIKSDYPVVIAEDNTITASNQNSFHAGIVVNSLNNGYAVLKNNIIENARDGIRVAGTQTSGDDLNPNPYVSQNLQIIGGTINGGKYGLHITDWHFRPGYDEEERPSPSLQNRVYLDGNLQINDQTDFRIRIFNDHTDIRPVTVKLGINLETNVDFDSIDYKEILSNEDFEAMAFDTSKDVLIVNQHKPNENSVIVERLVAYNGDKFYTSIQAAIDNADAGDTIEVAAGTYEENVTVATANLTIKGPNAGVSYNGVRGDEAVVQSSFNLQADNITIDGFRVENNNSTLNRERGIYIASEQTGTNILNNIIDGGGTATDGIFLSGINTMLEGNYIYGGSGSGNGLWTDVRGHLTVKSNMIEDYRSSMNFDTGTDGDFEITIQNNIFKPGERHGISIGANTSFNDYTFTIIGNTFMDTGASSISDRHTVDTTRDDGWRAHLLSHNTVPEGHVWYNNDGNEPPRWYLAVLNPSD